MALYLREENGELTCHEQENAPQVLRVKVPFSGFYATDHSYIFDNWLEYEQETLESEHDATTEQLQELEQKFYDGINWQAVYTDYAKAYCDNIVALIADASRKYTIGANGKRELSQPWKIQLEFDELKSPRCYNYETDCIYANVSVNDLFIMLYSVPREKWREFVKEKCTSYDGFTSFYSPNYDEWENDLSEWGEARLGMVLECYIAYIIENEACSDIEQALSACSLMQDYAGSGHLCNSLWKNATREFTEYADSLRKD